MNHEVHVSFSGGKDSTAMLLMMLDRGEQVDRVLWFNGGWEFAEMHDHVARVEQAIGSDVTKIEYDLTYYLTEYRFNCARGPHKGEPRQGYGWPSWCLRWCTTAKRESIKRYQCGLHCNYVSCIGMATDEIGRAEKMRASASRGPRETLRFPLIEWGVSEADALEYCLNRGLDWGGLYRARSRVSCWCCPLQRVATVRFLWHERPELWAELRAMTARIRKPMGRRFGRYTLDEWEAKFKRE